MIAASSKSCLICLILSAGLVLEGTERHTSENLIRAARLLRGGEAVKKRLGEKTYAFAMADQLWGVYQMIGKLCPTAYVLRR